MRVEGRTALLFNPHSIIRDLFHGLGQRPQLEVPLTPVKGVEQKAFAPRLQFKLPLICEVWSSDKFEKLRS
jgi:hypothetical protein